MEAFKEFIRNLFNIEPEIRVVEYEQPVIPELVEKWVDIDENTVTTYYGLYVCECLGDNHIVYDVREFFPGINIWEDYTKNRIKENGCVILKPKRYYYIPIKP